MKDKKLTTEHIPDSQKEAYIGAIISNVTTFFIVVATATALYDRGIPLINGDQAALAIKPFAGEFASVLFGLGLLNAGIIGMIIVGLSTSYAFTEFFGFEGTLDTGYARGRNFYLLFYVQLCIAFFIVLSPHVSAFQVATYTQSLNGILLPAIFYFLIQLSGDQSLMGAQVVGPVRKILLLFSSFVIVSASIFSMIYSMFF
jgi:Mn2+/Fe2+ NRAMP family transporter